MAKVSATYYLEFTSSTVGFLESVREFFSWMTMGTARRFTYLPIQTQELLAGSIVNIAIDPNNPLAGIVEYEFHEETFEEADLSLLLSVLLYSSIQGSTKQLRLLDLDLPESLWSAFPGPRFGSDGLRSFMPNHGVPLFGVILKPRQGLTPQLAASIASAATLGGADYVIDDEVLVNHPRCRLIERASAIIAACEPIAKRRGRPLLYVVNVISRESRVQHWLSELSKLQQGEVRLGIMVNGLVMGFETLTDIRRTMPEWPMIATTVASGMLILSPNYNVSEHVLVQLARLAGADAIYAVRHATEYAYDPSKIDTLQRHLSRREEFAKRSMPIYAGSISLGTIVRGELPSSPDFMVQAGSTVCGYTQVGQRFPDTIEITTRTMVEAITSVYGHGLDGQTVAENLVRQSHRHGGVDLLKLGLSV